MSCIREKALEIRVQPGVNKTVKNALVRAAPDRRKGTYAIEVTVTNTVKPTKQYEQAGITWYKDGRPVFKDQAAADQAIRELLDSEVEIKFIPMPLEWLEQDHVKLTPGEIDALAYLLELGDV